MTEVKSVVEEKMDEVYADKENKGNGIKTYDLNESIGNAKTELAALPEVTEIHIRFLARKHSPATLDHLAYAIYTHSWILLEQSQEGRLMLDANMGVFAEFIEKALFQHHKELSAKKLEAMMAEDAKAQMRDRKYGKISPLPKKK